MMICSSAAACCLFAKAGKPGVSQASEAVRNRLERFGAVVSDGLVFTSSDSWLFAPMRQWDQVVTEPAESDDPYADIVAAGIDAAVVAPEQDIAGCFSCPISKDMVDRLVRAGRVVRPGPGKVAKASWMVLN
jgi:hypothetical protein